MANTFGNRIRHAWNAFFARDPTKYYDYMGGGNSSRPDRVRMSRGNERSIISAVYNRISIDVASLALKHVRLDEEGRYVDTIDSGLNDVLTRSANLDQIPRACLQDIVTSLFDEGCIAIVPVDLDTNEDPTMSDAFDVLSIRVAKILEWYPASVRVQIYNEQTGKKEELTLSKRFVCIIENPFYSVMNEANSTLKRLIRKLNLLDAIDEQSGSGKLDLIIQLPYAIKTQARKDKAEERRKDLEAQMSGSKYGVAYTDGTEKVTQLNRPVENNLMLQITYLTNMLFSQLSITEGILNGTADEQTKLNYFANTIEPIISPIIDEMKRKWLSKTARTQLQSIMYFRDWFKLVIAKDMAEIADKFTRNAILSSNEIRSPMGYKPSKDPEADKLSNKNISAPPEANQVKEKAPNLEKEKTN